MILRNALIVLCVLAAVAAVATRANAGPGTSRSVAGNGRWIAFATQSAAEVYGGSDGTLFTKPGSDLFVTHPGGRTRLVAGRGREGEFWNVCPAFSPNGRMLAFARVDISVYPILSTITVVHIGLRGPLRPKRVVLKVPGSSSRAPTASPGTSSPTTRVARTRAARSPAGRRMGASSS